IQLPKNIKADFIFILIWTATSIYMAVTAARFMFNAAPAFAITAGWVVALLIEKLSIHKFSDQLKRFSRPAISRGFKFGLMGALVFLILVSVGLSGSADLAIGVLVIGIAALTGALMMNLIAETNPKRSFHLAAILVPLGGALFYLYAALGTEWTLTMATHGFILFAMIFIYFLLYLIVRRTKYSFTAGVIFLAFFIVLPNVWAGLDAGIPYETKRSYDEEVHAVMPVFMQPDDYANQSNWYLGGFGFSLPLNTRYWPAAYDWLATQDTEVYPPEDRPAFLSWWDYGFEAVNEGHHPTVADNFLGGHQLAGNFIMSQSEEDAIALLTSRLMEGNYHGVMSENLPNQFDDGMKAIITAHGLNLAVVENMMKNPSDYIDEILAHPEIYGPRDDIIQPNNARYIVLRNLITSTLTKEQVVALYHDVREHTGDSIRYFAIDSRMFPFSAENTGIFYAPAKLSDHRIDEIGNQPYDFWVIKAVSETGSEYDIDDIPPDVKLDPQTPYKIVYHDMFFNTMLYKTFIGFSPMDIGREMDAGIPGLTGELASEAIMPGWNLTHFKLVHRTGYYNPYPAEQIQNHTDAWQAMNYKDAQALQQTGEGISDLSDRSSLYQGVMMLKYYDGAIISGTVMLEDGTPVHGARVTVSDDFGIPHQMVYSDENGMYSVIAPFGAVKVTTSAGAENPRTLIGGELNITSMMIEDYQAMREPDDRNNDGRPDYLIDLDPVILSGNLNGILYWDEDENGAIGGAEEKIANAQLVLTNGHLNMDATGETNETGVFNITGIAPGDHSIEVYLAGRLIGSFDATVTSGENATQDFGAIPLPLKGKVTRNTGEAPGPTHVTAWIPGEDIVVEVLSDATGNYSFDTMLHGDYSIQAVTDDGWASVITMYSMNQEGNNSLDIEIYPSARVEGHVQLRDGTPVPTNAIRLLGFYEMLFYTGEDGTYALDIPRAAYDTLICEYVKGLDYYINISSDVIIFGDKRLDIYLDGGSKVYGQGFLANELTARNVEIELTDIESGSEISVHTNNQGIFTTTVPKGTYRVQTSAYINEVNWTYYGLHNLESSTELGFTMSKGTVVKGNIVWDVVTETGQRIGLDEARVTFKDTAGRENVVFTDRMGTFEAVLYPKKNYLVTIEKPGFVTVSLGTKTTEVLAANPIYESLSPITVPVSGTVLMNGLPLEDTNLVLEFEGQSAGATDHEVQIYQDGTYSINIPPGEYWVTFSYSPDPGNDSVKIEIAKPFMLETDFYTGSPLKYDLEARLRAKVNVNVLTATPVNSNIQFSNGPELRNFTVQNGSGVFYVMPGEYTFTAAYSTNDTYLLGMTAVNISTSKDNVVSVSLDNGIEIHGILTYKDSKIGSKDISFIDEDSGGVVTVRTTADAEYTVYVIPNRNYTIDVDFIDFVTDPSLEFESVATRTAYRYTNSDSFYTSADMTTVRPITLIREEYYTNVNGVVKANGAAAPFSEISFTSSSGTEEVTAGEDGTFALDIKPGNHTVYVHHGQSHMVYLEYQYFGIDPIEGLVIDLVEGYKLSGTTYYNLNQHKETSLYFTSGDRYMEVLSDDLGFYETWLPPDSYDVTGKAVAEENGLDVNYELDMSITLESDLLINLPMTRVEKVSVTLEYDETNIITARPGEKVTYTVRVVNTGNVADTYAMGASGANPDWVFEFNPVDVQVNPGTKDNIGYTKISFTVPEAATTAQNRFSVTAVSHRAGITASLNMEVNIVQNYSVGVYEIPQASPLYNVGSLRWSFRLQNDGNGQDAFDMTIVNLEELRSRGWAPQIAWDEDIGGELLDENTIVGLPLSAGASMSINVELVPYGKHQSRTARVLVAAYSNGDVSESTSRYFTIAYPELNPYSSNMTVFGDDVHDAPTGSEAANAGVMVVAVAATLIIFYVARKKRWLR
ncbi:MAG: hypothetical protein AYK23_01735, partial [Candidatus Proteinoplasmatales archaeon SG8-5]